MNKEEKRINYLLDTIIECPSMQADELRKRIRRLFKTIEKQQKEIEELKTITREYETYKCGEGNKIVIASKEYFINGFFEDFLNGYISKDKIREKIEELKSIGKYQLDHKDLYLEQEKIDLLQELLGGKE